MESDRAMLWTVAVAASLGLHVLIIVALLGFGAITSPSAVPDPPSPKPAPAVSESGTDPKPIGTAPKPVTNEPVDTAPKTVGRFPADDKFYIVKQGDNLSKIAKLDDSSIAELAELNGKSVKELNKLFVGQKIRVKNGIK